MTDPTAWIGAVAALSGTALGAGMTIWGESLRARRQIRSDLWKERQALNVRYLVACGEAVREVESAARFLADFPTGPRRDPLATDFDGVGDDCAPLVEELQVYASEQLAQAASNLLSSVWELKELVRAGSSKTDPDYAASLANYVESRRLYIAAMNEDLQVLSGGPR